MESSKELFELAVSEHGLNKVIITECKNKKRIGRGGFGTVFKCDIGVSFGMVAIKEMPVCDEDDRNTIKVFLNE
ncbi:3647_t:CDS:1, partial [Acaulospora colombiana]